MGRYIPEKWGVVSFGVSNSSDTDAECLVISSFEENSLLQFGRRIWVPSHSRRRSWFPVLPPKTLVDEKKQSSVLNTYFYDLSNGDRTLVRTPQGEMKFDNLMRLGMGKQYTGFLGSRDDVDSYEAVIAARVSHGLTRIVVSFGGRAMVPSPELLQGMDHLVLSGNRFLDNVSELTTIRHWVENGGKLWIMLDLVDPEIVEQLVGDVFDCEVVGRVGLTTVELKDELPSLIKDGKAHSEVQVQEYEEPVELLRVVVQNKNVTHTVEGWPAAFRQRLGRGEVLFTTLGARGWMRLRTPGDPKPADYTTDAKHVALAPLTQVTASIFGGANGISETVDVNAFEPFLSEQVGYRILSFGSILSILGAFCLLLLGGAYYFVRQGRLERLGWFGPLVSVVTGGILLGLTFQSRHAVPAMVAEAQYVEVVPETGDLNVNGLLAVYHQDRSEEEIGVKQGGFFVPDTSSVGGTARRMIWTDMDQWHFEDFSLPPGVQTASFHHTLSLKENVEARARFGPEGLSGKISSGLSGTLEDSILATSVSYSAALSLDGEGNFSVDSGDVLARDEYISETLLSDQQRRRQDVYRTLLPKSRNERSGSHPVLFAWTDLLDTHFHFPEVKRREGAALVSIPIFIERTPPDMKVAIPATFLSFRVLEGTEAGDPEKGFSSPYNRRFGWSGRSEPARIKLEFQLPQQVLPLDVNRVVLSARLSGPPQKLDVYSLGDGGKTLLESVARSIGTTRFEIDRKEFLQVDSSGHLTLGLYVGKFEPPSSDEPEVLDPKKWKIEDLQLEVFGVTRPASERE